MPLHIIIGAQWGDEGKGRVTDLLAAEAHVVARYSGGDNAGHTVTVDGPDGPRIFKLHLLPSGLIQPHVVGVLGHGMVINPSRLLEEIGYPYKPFDRRHTPNSNWPRISGLRVLNGSTLGIIGVGEIGREIAIRAAAFNMRILYYQRTRLPADEERELKAAYVPLETLLAQSDWVVPQLPGGPETSGFLDRERLAQMKPGAFLVNISRAELVDRTALIEVLKSERLGGFALDPLYEVPGRSDDELLAFNNVVLSPHIAAQPRFNALEDLAELMEGLAKELAP